MTHPDPDLHANANANANYGVQQSGGHSQVGNQAIGPNARAVAHQIAFQSAAPAGSAERIEQLLTTIQQLLTAHAAELPDPDAPQVELRRLREELDEAEPQPGVLRRALDRLAAIAVPIVPLATAVAELSTVVLG
ncbi:hypothetical protein ACIRBX_19600 [Kitasatospora sp. NPDC096147]|uniref:hypothetical protein n=1 Tax=Kitasatospora sp. NPDC096147 TaxID=3364093 RepID=UPI0037F3D5C2